VASVYITSNSLFIGIWLLWEPNIPLLGYFKMTFDETKKIREVWGLPMWRGHVRIKAVNCGKKNCKMCPHAYYLYFRKGSYNHVKEQYIGKCDKNGMPR